MAAIEVRDLVKRYGRLEAVAGVSFSVAEGEVFALLGPNGAGKTTTVEILEGHRRRTAGAVSVLGTDPAGGGRRWRERIGIVLQEAAIEDQLTLGEAVEIYAAPYPAPLPPHEVVGLVGLEAEAGERIGTLSAGQRRRLDLALGLAGDPDLLFLDEPTTGFDPGARRDAWELVGRLRSLGKTMLLTTHYMEEAQQLADRVAVLVGGRIVAQGRPEQIGRAGAPSRVSFRLPPGWDPAVVEELGGSLRGDRVELVTDRPTEVVHRITTLALERGAELEGLRVTPPTLEDAYLSLTRHAERDDG